MRRYELHTIGPTPNWWAEVFFRHQVELRALLRSLTNAPGQWMAREDFSLLTIQYDPREVDFALTQMVNDGVLICTDGRYQNPKEIPCASLLKS